MAHTTLSPAKSARETIEDACEQPQIHIDPVESAKTAGLRYVMDTKPGITRRAANEGFEYIDPKGGVISDASEIERINKLAIPPAYTHVWICPDKRGHLQATGRDAKGRKQYRYHERWREVRDENKYGRMLAFGEALPIIRERVARDLARRGLPREKLLATIVRLLEETHIRIGNDEYAKTNDSYGLTTMHNEHVEVDGSTLHFHFRGKSGKSHSIDLRDPRIAKIVKQTQELPGQDLFEFAGQDGQPHSINSSDVNAYLHEITGHEFTAKDFRTWAGTILAAQALSQADAAQSTTQAKRIVSAVIKSVASELGNTPAVCRKCYVHPAILDAYTDGTLLAALGGEIQETERHSPALRQEETAMMRLLQERLQSRK